MGERWGGLFRVVHSDRLRYKGKTQFLILEQVTNSLFFLTTHKNNQNKFKPVVLLSKTLFTRLSIAVKKCYAVGLSL